MDANSLRVHAPTPVLFLCGGEIKISAALPVSLRDAFIRVSDRKAFKRYNIVLAEELKSPFLNGGYDDLLALESDVAQISELVVLFSESFGSAAELGAFSMVREISSRLLVIIDDKNYEDESFVKLGPLRSLELAYGDSAVFVLNRHDIEISNVQKVDSINLAVFADKIGAALSDRAKSFREHTSFDAERPGHIIKLIVGLIQHYSALTLEEIDVHLFSFSIVISEKRLKNFLLCAESVRWVWKNKQGFKTYFCAVFENEVLQYKLRRDVTSFSDMASLSKERWRATIVQHWQEEDPERFTSIQAAVRRRVR